METKFDVTDEECMSSTNESNSKSSGTSKCFKVLGVCLLITLVVAGVGCYTVATAIGTPFSTTPSAASVSESSVDVSPSDARTVKEPQARSPQRKVSPAPSGTLMLMNEPAGIPTPQYFFGNEIDGPKCEELDTIETSGWLDREDQCKVLYQAGQLDFDAVLAQMKQATKMNLFVKAMQMAIAENRTNIATRRDVFVALRSWQEAYPFQPVPNCLPELMYSVAEKSITPLTMAEFDVLLSIHEASLVMHDWSTLQFALEMEHAVRFPQSSGQGRDRKERSFSAKNIDNQIATFKAVYWFAPEDRRSDLISSIGKIKIASSLQRDSDAFTNFTGGVELFKRHVSEAKSSSQSTPFEIKFDVPVLDWYFYDIAAAVAAQRPIVGDLKVDDIAQVIEFLSLPVFDDSYRRNLPKVVEKLLRLQSSSLIPKILGKIFLPHLKVEHLINIKNCLVAIRKAYPTVGISVLVQTVAAWRTRWNDAPQEQLEVYEQLLEEIPQLKVSVSY